MARIEFFDTYDMSYLNDAVEEAACNHAPGDLIPGDARIPDLTESQWESLIFAMAGPGDTVQPVGVDRPYRTPTPARHHLTRQS
jgi:hypothetical protein